MQMIATRGEQVEHSMSAGTDTTTSGRVALELTRAFAAAGERLKPVTESNLIAAQAVALTPSDIRVEEQLDERIKRAKGVPLELRELNPNQLSVVAHVTCVATRQVTLLGGDLESGRAAWRHVAETARRYECLPAAFFKVPHHGSSTGDLGDAHNELIAPDSTCVATPFNSGGPDGRPPHREQLQHLASLGHRVWVVGPIGATWAGRAGGYPPNRVGHLQIRIRDGDARFKPRGPVTTPNELRELLRE
jgi:hypothetical protein